MKTKILLFLSAMFLLAGHLLAQDAKDEGDAQRQKRPDFKEMQLRQMLNALMLDDETAAKFTPVYKEYQEEMEACRLPQVKKPRKAEMTDDEIAQEIEQQFAQGRKLIDVKEKYYKKFKKILTMKQIRKIYSLERFNMRRVGREMDRRQHRGKAPMPQKPRRERNQEA